MSESSANTFPKSIYKDTSDMQNLLFLPTNTMSTISYDSPSNVIVSFKDKLSHDQQFCTQDLVSFETYCYDHSNNYDIRCFESFDHMPNIKSNGCTDGVYGKTDETRVNNKQTNVNSLVLDESQTLDFLETDLSSVSAAHAVSVDQSDERLCHGVGLDPPAY